MTTNLRTIRDFTRFAMTEFEQCGVSLGHGSEDLWQEATFLVLRSLSLPFDRLESFWDASLTEEEKTLLLKRIRARAVDKIPAAYILGEAWLMGERFLVNENVLIPRSFIAELLEEQLSPWIEDPDSVSTILDMCTGSGCLAILAQKAFENALVTGADISQAALETAEENLEERGLAGEIELIESDQFSSLSGRRFDLILCNPPYVTDDAMSHLPAEYQHEPEIALASGADGMDFMRRFIPELSKHLTDKGQAFIEIGDGKEAFEAIWPNLPVTWIETSGGSALVLRITAQDIKAAGF